MSHKVSISYTDVLWQIWQCVCVCEKSVPWNKLRINKNTPRCENEPYTLRKGGVCMNELYEERYIFDFSCQPCLNKQQGFPC